MSHLDPDESQDWNDDIDAFEQQLRAIRPTAPTQSFSSIDESQEPATEQPSVVTSTSISTTTSMRRLVLSHAATAMIGLAAGVVVMLMRQPSIPASNGTSGIHNSSGTPTELVDTRSSNQPQRFASDQKTPRHMGEPFQATLGRSEPSARSSRFSEANLNSGSLRAFGPINDRLASSRDWLTQPDISQRSHQPTTSEVNDNSNDRPDDVPVEQPVLSPRSLHLLLNDLSYSPISNQPVLTTEDFSS